MGDEPDGSRGPRRGAPDVDPSTLIMVLEPGEGGALMTWGAANMTYPLLFTERMRLVRFDKKSDLCFVSIGTEFVPDSTKLCLRGPVIVTRVSGETPVSLELEDICRAAEYFGRRTETAQLPGGGTVKVFNLRKGENDGSEGI